MNLMAKITDNSRSTIGLKGRSSILTILTPKLNALSFLNPVDIAF